MKKETLLLLSFCAAFTGVGVYSLSRTSKYPSAEAVPPWLFLFSLLLPFSVMCCFMVCLFGNRICICGRRSISRFGVRHAQQTLWKHMRPGRCVDSRARYLHRMLVQRLNRHLSDFVEDGNHPSVVYYRAYAEDLHEKLKSTRDI